MCVSTFLNSKASWCLKKMLEPSMVFVQDHRVDVDDISATLTSLRHIWKAEEVRNMLWEVDDDGRGYLSLRRFQQVYYRVRARWDFVVLHCWMVLYFAYSLLPAFQHAQG